ncbi:nitroimidazol reductase NimA-like FMN-containing flavoprotein (pyridoxamine 5'-phosphate oxidase superfamily) [Kitasatospora gansuensis]|uniref:Nitroimidazol reductase NimA-like FMN-containing flavoprotein (Pyridoxamine 5'-phosphate oxidase superfamily) n=1 Tax=Kitasatospora gansuensis TaxID=258050 RepID=A0A7W7SI78_9ACTN|nr:pyridoxamine 5'-phosphate oxidase family protein [Kitasatospora gansuensis]MBB4950837.1 nitroimidazol reductase NimA-like FMN-containing flavoprotein (pyridoxamine 5'-phosphate oxidase superfamily) [Kitasatospora gansuensis]
MSDTASYTRNERTTPTRYRDRATWERDAIHAILDAAYVCHLGFVANGTPVVLPTIFARVGDRLYVHGSTGSRPMRGAADEGMPVCVTVTLVDGLVLTKSAFNHSVNFRSVVAQGIAQQVTDPEELAVALDALVDHSIPGRSGEVRRPNAKELAKTAVVRLVLDEVSAKTRADGADDDEEDLDLPYWAGVIPVSTVYGTPEPHESSTGELPAHLQNFRR